MDDKENIFKEQEAFNSTTDLSPAEHALIGSTTYLNGEQFGSKELFKKLEEEKLDLSLFKPVGFNSKSKVDEINERRKNKEYLSGMLSFVDLNSQFDLYDEKGYSPAVYLSEINPESIRPEFRIGLIDSGENFASTDYSLKFFKNNLAEEYAEHFDVKKKDNNVYLVKK